MAALEAEVVSSRPPVYRDYSPEFKAEIIAQVKANGGSTLRVSEETGIARQTIDYWIKQEEQYAQFRQQKQLDLATKYEFNLHRLTDSIASQDLESVPLGQKATAVGILTEKMLLLRGQPTSISANIERTELTVILQHALGAALDDSATHSEE